MFRLIVFYFILLHSLNMEAKSIDIYLDTKTYQIPTMELSINGNKPQVFGLDTGSGFALHLPKKMIDRIEGLIITDKTYSSIDLAGTLFFDNIFTIPIVNIHGMRFYNINGIELRPWGLNIVDTEDEPEFWTFPIIGLSFFRYHILMIDFHSQRLRIEESQNSNFIIKDNDWISLPFQLTEDGLLINVTDGEKQYKLVLDSGASFSMINKRKVIKNTPILPCDELFSPEEIEDCEIIKVNLIDSKKIVTDVYPILIDNFPAEFNADGLLGTDFFKLFTIRIDFLSNSLMIKPITHITDVN